MMPNPADRENDKKIAAAAAEGAALIVAPENIEVLDPPVDKTRIIILRMSRSNSDLTTTGSMYGKCRTTCWRERKRSQRAKRPSLADFCVSREPSPDSWWAVRREPRSARSLANWRAT